MTTYIIFKPDSHYAYPKGIRSSNFMMPYEREMLLKLYEESDYNSFTMGDYETIEEAFDDYGDAKCFHAVYIIDADITSDEWENIQDEVAQLMQDGMEFYSSDEEMLKILKATDPYALIISNVIGGKNVISINTESWEICASKNGVESISSTGTDTLVNVADSLVLSIKKGEINSNKIIAAIAENLPELWEIMEPKLGSGSGQSRNLGELGF